MGMLEDLSDDLRKRIFEGEVDAAAERLWLLLRSFPVFTSVTLTESTYKNYARLGPTVFATYPEHILAFHPVGSDSFQGWKVTLNGDVPSPQGRKCDLVHLSHIPDMLKALRITP